MDIIARIAFGIDTQSQQQDDSQFIYYCRKALNFTFTDYKLICDALFPNVMSTMEEALQRTIFDNDCNEFFKSIVPAIRAERQKNPRMKDAKFIQHLLDISHNEERFTNRIDQRSQTDGEQAIKDQDLSIKHYHLSDIELAGQCFLFLIAGYETSASTMQFALFSLSNNLHIQQQAYEEIISIIGDKESVTYEDLSKMEFVEQIMMETLRMYPPAPRFDRECSSPITINNIHFEKNCIVSVPIFAIHYNSDVYKDPYKFIPERFTPENKAKRNQLAFVPFGYGPRNCLGRRFAILEIKLTLAYLLRAFQFLPTSETPEVPLALNTAGMTRPMKPIVLRVQKRSAPQK